MVVADMAVEATEVSYYEVKRKVGRNSKLRMY